MSSFAIREAKLRQAIADASSLSEQRRLNAQLTALQREASDQKAIDREVDLAATVVRDTVTPVRVHDRHTAASDWLSEIEVPAGGDYPNKMRVEASLWFKKLHNAVKEDRDEFAEQAQGMADRLAGQFGLQAPAARQAFLDEVARLFRLADDRASDQEPDEDQSGNAESQVTDYDPEVGQDPMWSEDWDGEDDTGSQIGSEQPSEQPGATARRRRYPKGSARGGGRTATRKSAIQTGTSDKHWYNEGYDKGEQFSREFGGDPYDAPDPLSGEFAGESIPEIFGSWDDATEDAMDAYEEGYWAAVAGEPRQASRKQSVRKQAAPPWAPQSGDRVTVNGQSGEVVEKSGMGRYVIRFDAGYTVSDIPRSDLKKSSRKVANDEGKTCATCGDSIAQTDGEWHHDNGEKHDHEAKPGSDKESRRRVAVNSGTCSVCGEAIEQEGDGSWSHNVDNDDKDHEAKPSKESRRKTAGVYCNTHQVWVGDENKATHENCSKEQKATEKTKDARRKRAQGEPIVGIPQTYVVVDTNTLEVLSEPMPFDGAQAEMMLIGTDYPTDEFGGVPLGITETDNAAGSHPAWQYNAVLKKRAAIWFDDDSGSRYCEFEIQTTDESGNPIPGGQRDYSSARAATGHAVGGGKDVWACDEHKGEALAKVGVKKRAADDDDTDEVSEETNQFAEEVAEELSDGDDSDGDDDSEPVDNGDDDEVSSEDDDDTTEEEKEARLRRFRASVQQNLLLR